MVIKQAILTKCTILRILYETIGTAYKTIHSYISCGINLIAVIARVDMKTYTRVQREQLTDTCARVPNPSNRIMPYMAYAINGSKRLYSIVVLNRCETLYWPFVCVHGVVI